MTYHYQDHDTTVLGSGELYIGAVANPEEATEVEIIAALKNIGAIASGASLQYTPEFTEVNSANRGVIMRFLTKESVSFNAGILTWNLENLELLSTGETTTDEITGEKRIKIGGNGGTVPVNYLRFVHEKADGGKIIVNIAKAQSTSGFSFEFSRENPVEIGYEFQSLAQQNGTLVEIVETFPQV